MDREWDARPVGRLRLAPFLRWIVLGGLGVLAAVGTLTVLMVATYPGSGADRDRRSWPALALEAGAAEAGTALAEGEPVPPPLLASSDGCAGRETFCAVLATDDPGAALQQLGAAWRQGEGKRFRLRVWVAQEEP